jgi:hypothetical protein
MNRLHDVLTAAVGTFGRLKPNGEIVPVTDAIEWAEAMEESYRDGSHWIAQDRVEGFSVSTVFLGINHDPFGGLPQWFETMVFRLAKDGQVTNWHHYSGCRYATRTEAIAGHARTCEMVRTGEIGE